MCESNRFVSDKHTILDLIGIRLPKKTLLSRMADVAAVNNKSLPLVARGSLIV